MQFRSSPAAESNPAGSHGSHKNDDFLKELLKEIELWHTEEGVTYASIIKNGHTEHWPTKSKAFRQWVAKSYYDATGKLLANQSLNDFLFALEGKGLHDGPQYSLYIRVAEHDGSIYIDLCDESWRMVKIDKKGWRIVNSGPVRFRRAKGMLPIPAPVHGGNINELFNFVNVTQPDRVLISCWLVDTLRANHPHPILKFLGEQGSGKSTDAKVLRALADPNKALTRSAPRNEQDLAIAAHNGWIISLDNLSYVSPEKSDSLCRVSTGAGFAARTLYSDDEETIISVQRPIILNGIEDIGTRSDLLDREIIIEVPNLKDRKSEGLFWKQFEEARPRILGALLTAASSALNRLPGVQKYKRDLPRMADFAQWSIAAETALGFKAGTFLEAYNANRTAANHTVLESSTVVCAILDMFASTVGVKTPAIKEWKGTATDLIREISVGQDIKAKGWPKSAKVLSGMLRRLAPNFRQEGIEIEQVSEGTGDDKRKVWKITNKKPPKKKSLQSCDPIDPATQTLDL